RDVITDSGWDCDTALTVVRSSTVFTTHTPVAAGIDRFPVDMVRLYFDDHQDGHQDSQADGDGTDKDAPTLLPGLPTARIIALGAEDDPAKFNMAHMGLRLAQRGNGVSVARRRG